MKYIPTFVNAALCCILLFILAAAGLPAGHAQAAASTPSAQPAVAIQPACDTSRSIQVSGSAVVNVLPDRALVTLGVQSNGLSPRLVQAANTINTQRILAALHTIGIEPKDIATDYYVITPVYQDYSSLQIKGYRIDNSLAITIRDVGKLNDVLIAALDAGANQVLNVDLYTSELRKYRDQARDLAIRAAKEKAQALAAGAGSQIGCVIHIDENTWSAYNGWWYGRNQNPAAQTQNVIQNAAQSGDIF